MVNKDQCGGYSTDDSGRAACSNCKGCKNAVKKPITVKSKKEKEADTEKGIEKNK
jgi:hypothetical protein